MKFSKRDAVFLAVGFGAAVYAARRAIERAQLNSATNQLIKDNSLLFF